MIEKQKRHDLWNLLNIILIECYLMWLAATHTYRFVFARKSWTTLIMADDFFFTFKKDDRSSLIVCTTPTFCRHLWDPLPIKVMNTKRFFLLFSFKSVFLVSSVHYFDKSIFIFYFLLLYIGL